MALGSRELAEENFRGCGIGFFRFGLDWKSSLVTICRGLGTGTEKGPQYSLDKVFDLKNEPNEITAYNNESS
jgi:hypothetical protein